MKVLKDGNGELLVKVPNSDWYNYVGTRKYIPENVARNFDTVYVRDRSLKKAVKSCIDYNSCTDKYWRDQSGKLLRFNHSLYKAIDMRLQVEIKMVGYRYDPLSLYVGLHVPFTDGRWRLITGVTDNMVELDGEKLRDKPYVISEMIGYMNACLPNKNGVDTIVSDFNGELHTVVNGFYIEDSDTDVDGFDTKEIDDLIKKLTNKIENKVYELPEEPKKPEGIRRNPNESVNHPSHYNHGGRETIEIIKDHLNDSDWNAYQGGLLFNVYKYIDRAPYNGKRVEDLKEAAWYLNKLIDEIGEK